MKKIILLFFTFLGICSCFSQELLKKGDSIDATQQPVANTLPLKTDAIKAREKSSVRLYPNPTRNKVEVEIKGFEPGNVKVQLLSGTGKIIREEKRLVFSGNEIIIFMFSETPGLYYLLLKQGDQTVKTKLVIQ
jgi:hypothetical protein